jgi:hypothetical protein
MVNFWREKIVLCNRWRDADLTSMPKFGANEAACKRIRGLTYSVLYLTDGNFYVEDIGFNRWADYLAVDFPPTIEVHADACLVRGNPFSASAEESSRQKGRWDVSCNFNHFEFSARQPFSASVKDCKLFLFSSRRQKGRWDVSCNFNQFEFSARRTATTSTNQLLLPRSKCEVLTRAVFVRILWKT